MQRDIKRLMCAAGMVLLTYFVIFQAILEQCVCTNAYENTTNERNLLPVNKNSSVEHFQIEEHLDAQFENVAEKDNITETFNGNITNNTLNANITNNTFNGNITNNTFNGNITNNKKIPWKPDEPEKELPFAIIVAGPTAAFIVVVFLCVAFYFHNVQLNKNAQKISLTLYIPPDVNSDQDENDTITPLPLPKVSQSQVPIVPASVSTSPSSARLSRNLSTVSVRMSRDNSFQTVRLTREPSTQQIRLAKDSDILMSPKKSTVSLGLPSRGSILSAFADQEIVNQSAKRKHSIFFI